MVIIGNMNLLGLLSHIVRLMVTPSYHHLHCYWILQLQLKPLELLSQLLHWVAIQQLLIYYCYWFLKPVWLPLPQIQIPLSLISTMLWVNYHFLIIHFVNSITITRVSYMSMIPFWECALFVIKVIIIFINNMTNYLFY